MPISIPEIISNLPDILDLVQAVEDAGKAEAAATNFAGRVKALEPVLEKAAALVDKVKAQIAD